MTYPHYPFINKILESIKYPLLACFLAGLVVLAGVITTQLCAHNCVGFRLGGPDVNASDGTVVVSNCADFDRGVGGVGESGDEHATVLAQSLQEWAQHEPRSALAYAKKLPVAIRSFAIRTVLEEMAHFPAIAMSEGQKLFSEEPDHIDDYGTVLIGSLCRACEFASAFDLAGTQGTDSSRDGWLALIAGSWARERPDAAHELAMLFLQQGMHGQMLTSLIKGWATSAPETLANYALRLRSGEERTTALNLAIANWISRDPISAAEWIGLRLKETPEFDSALATLLTRTDSVFCSAQTSVEWATGINDPVLRMNVLTNLVKTWAAQDGAAATNFIQNGAPIASSEREVLLASLASHTNS